MAQDLLPLLRIQRDGFKFRFSIHQSEKVPFLTIRVHGYDIVQSLAVKCLQCFKSCQRFRLYLLERLPLEVYFIFFHFSVLESK